MYRRTRTRKCRRGKTRSADALAEGIEIQYLYAPQQILTKDNKVIGVQCIKMELGEPDSSGRRRPVPIPGSEFTVEADLVIPAIGQTPSSQFLAETRKVSSCTRWGTIEAG